jgi:FMN phosphatase YigB (HAD superfamily)
VGEQAVHIGDSLAADVQGSVNAGLAAAIWINKKGTLPDGHLPSPHFVVSHVTDLPKVLGALSQK